MTIQSSILGTWCIRFIAIWAMVHGALTCLGGIARWGSPAYDIVRLLPGSPYTWGIILIVGGFLAFLASHLGVEFQKHLWKFVVDYRSIKNTGLWIIAITCFLFAMGVITAAFQPGSPVSLAAGDRDLLICVLSIMMTKAYEPKYKKLR